MKVLEVREDFYSADLMMLLKIICRASSDDLLCTREMLNCSLQMLHYPESGIRDSVQVTQKHEAVSQKRNAVWWC